MQRLLICPLHLHTVATLPWEKLLCGFGTILADLLSQNAVKSTSKNLRTKSDRWKIFDVAYYHDVVLMQEMQSPTCAIAVTLTSYSKTVCQLIVRVSQLSYCNVKLLSSLVQRPRLYYLQLADLSTVEDRIRGISGKIVCTRRQPVQAWLTWDSVWLTLEMAWHKALSTMPLIEWRKRLQASVCKKEAIWTLSVIFRVWWTMIL